LTHSEAYFSPDEHPTDKLIQLINNTQHKLHAAIYMLTDKQIAQALIDAKKRGVDVKIIVDQATMDFEYGKGKFLKNSDIEIYIYSPKSKTRSSNKRLPIMHHKFAILDDKIWTGSFNWTKSANQRNQENVIITTNKKVYAKFEKQFEILKNRTVELQSRKNNQEESSSIENLWEIFKKIFILNPD
jgi:phosphatidylserine/phosphatidylglycerophosphate/cardiolipin synthase-like enzyme